MAFTQQYIKFEISWSEISDAFEEEIQYFNLTEFDKNFKEMEKNVKNCAQKLFSNVIFM